MSFRLTSPAFANGGTIPKQYTCDGNGTSPALTWENPPNGTRSFAMIMHDPDTARGDVTHWMIWDMPARKRGLGEDEGHRMNGASGQNEHGEISYLPPTPPQGDTPHRYIFELFALDVPELDIARGSPREPVESAISAHALGVAQLTGVFGRG